ncbi:conserved hypothetical protein [Anaeromyxobacter sp. K]|uniref:hypothetical protein n=1 Tax=Anaeromyxobacter sp. (strain K) TaxID=447217 RepID=UPI00015F89FD|nr:hypothetical protein [Anaeromyxobacter sp. K]ACG73214.1 conserved hypothetical protein [Anaeromyxobacter sp. K]
MKRLALAALLAGLAAPALGATKTYQVTGPVVEVGDESITVQKGKEKWEIARSADTKLAGEVKKGDKVTVEYRMTATNIEVKPAGKAAAKAK